RGLVVEVAHEHVGTAHPDLAGITDQYVLTVGVDQADLETGHRRTDRTERGVGASGRRYDGRGFGEPVTLVEVEPEAILDELGDLDRQLGRARCRDAHRAEGQRADAGQAGPRRPHRWRAADDRDLVALDGLEARRRIE